MANIAAPGESFTYSDGNVLHYKIYGNRNAPHTLFFHHGLPGSHIEGSIYDHSAMRSNIQIISVDRPGMGYSTFQPSFRILDWPPKLIALADHLGIEVFGVLGVSGGGPYVLACIHQLPNTRCLGGGIVAGVYPASLGWNGMAFETRLLFTVGGWTTWLVEKTLEYILGSIARDRDHPEKLEDFLTKTFDSRPEVDRAVWDTNEKCIKTILVEDSRVALQNGSRGAALETNLVSNDWGFEVADIFIKHGTLVMWHGELDANWPVGMARKAVSLISGSELRVSDTDGHVSIFAKTVDEVIDTMSNMLQG